MVALDAFVNGYRWSVLQFIFDQVLKVIVSCFIISGTVLKTPFRCRFLVYLRKCEQECIRSECNQSHCTITSLQRILYIRFTETVVPYTYTIYKLKSFLLKGRNIRFLTHFYVLLLRYTFMYENQRTNGRFEDCLSSIVMKRYF